MLDHAPTCPNCGRATEDRCVTVNGAQYCCLDCAGGDACTCALPDDEAGEELGGAVERGRGHAARDNMVAG